MLATSTRSATTRRRTAVVPPPERRVLAVVRWALGGIRTYIQYHYPHLVAAGYRFTFVLPRHPAFDSFRAHVSAWPGTEFVTAPFVGRRCFLAAGIRRALASGNYDLIHSHGLTAAATTVLSAWGAGVPHVATSHETFQPERVAGLAWRTKLWLLAQLLARTDGVVCVSEDARDNLLTYLPALGRGRPRLTAIRSGIDADLFAATAPAADDLRRQLGVGPDVFLMGYLGRFMEEKGFRPLLGALQRVKANAPARPFHLVAVGSGDYQREYQAEAEQRGLADCVTFLPFVADVAPVLRQLDLVVMPSLHEACGLVAMEAMAAGVPVVGSNCVGLREVLRDTPAVTTPPGDPVALAEALGQAITSPATEAARSFAPVARGRFSARAAAARLWLLFEEVLARRTEVDRCPR